MDMYQIILNQGERSMFIDFMSHFYLCNKIPTISMHEEKSVKLICWTDRFIQTWSRFGFACILLKGLSLLVLINDKNKKEDIVKSLIQDKHVDTIFHNLKNFHYCFTNVHVAFTIAEIKIHAPSDESHLILL